MRWPVSFLAIVTVLLSVTLLTGRDASVSPLMVIAIAAILVMAAVGFGLLLAEVRRCWARRDIQREMRRHR
jgi:hypothetical protein